MLKIKEIAIVLLAVLASLAAASLFADASDAEAGDAHELSIVVKGGDCTFKDCGETVPAYNSSGQALSDGSQVGAGSYVLICPDSLNNTEDKLVGISVKSNGQDVAYETLKYSDTSAARQYYFAMPDADAEVEIEFTGHKVIITGEGGTVKAAKSVNYQTRYPTYFFEGDTVRLTPTADAGYEYVSMEITSGNAEITSVIDTTVSFKMPAEDVEISATFAKLAVGKIVISGNVEYRLTSLDPYECVVVGYVDGITTAQISKTVRFGSTSVNVVSIGSKAFYGCYTLTSVRILADASIESKAFAWCDSLLTINITGSVETIGAGAFHGCTDVESISLPSTLNSFGKGAFYGITFMNLDGTKELKKTPSALRGHSFEGSEGVLCRAPEIGDRFVEGGLEYLLVPTPYSTAASASLVGFVESPVDLVADTVTFHGKTFNIISIGSKAFYKCETLKSVSFGTKMAEVGYKAFAKCTSLESITLPTNVRMIDFKKIGEYAFFGCTSLKEFTLPRSVYNNQYNYPVIMASAFSYCTGLTSVVITSGLTTDIGEKAFYKCTSLTNLNLTAARSIGDKAFAYCTGLTTLDISSSLCTISDHAFYGCSGLNTLSLNVNSIGYGVFSECKNLEYVKFSKVTEIGEKAFFRCKFYSADGDRLDATVENLVGHTFQGTYDKLVMTA